MGPMGRGGARNRSEEYLPERPERSELCANHNAKPVEGVEKLCDFIQAFDLKDRRGRHGRSYNIK